VASLSAENAKLEVMTTVSTHGICGGGYRKDEIRRLGLIIDPIGRWRPDREVSKFFGGTGSKIWSRPG
jgi:hypothetical protein